MQEVDQAFLLAFAGVAGTLLGTFVVGVFFYIDSEMHMRLEVSEAADRYQRSSIRWVFTAYSVALFVPPRIRCASSAVGLARVRTVRSRPPGDDRRLRSQDPRKGGLGVFSSPRSQSMALQRRSRVSADPPLGARRVGSITRRVCSLPPASARDWVHQHRGADHGAVRRDHGHGRRNHRDEVSPGVGLETAALGGARAS